MEKLIGLLYEYQKIKCFYPLYYDVEENKIYFDSDTIIWAEQYLISKEFWFIERLVENDKIDTQELLGIYWETSQSIWETNKYELYPAYKRLLMLLAIQDDPIEFLIRLLK